MPTSIEAAKAGATTGEWAQEMRNIYGEYRGPTGVAIGISNKTDGLDELRSAVDAVSDKLGERLKFLIGKPGLDGHSNGAEQIASRARDCGMKIEYEGIRLTPQELVEAVKSTKAHVVGLSILSGSHIPLVQDMITLLTKEGLTKIPIVVGGIIPEEDKAKLLKMGISKVYTPKDFEMNTIMMDIVNLAEPREIAAE
jgi:(2R)-ethylmalonyl-CoA mutase